MPKLKLYYYDGHQEVKHVHVVEEDDLILPDVIAHMENFLAGIGFIIRGNLGIIKEEEHK